MTLGVKKEDYSVYIGDKPCKVTQLIDMNLRCSPLKPVSVTGDKETVVVCL